MDSNDIDVKDSDVKDLEVQDTEETNEVEYSLHTTRKANDTIALTIYKKTNNSKLFFTNATINMLVVPIDNKKLVGLEIKLASIKPVNESVAVVKQIIRWIASAFQYINFDDSMLSLFKVQLYSLVKEFNKSSDNSVSDPDTIKFIVYYNKNLTASNIIDIDQTYELNIKFFDKKEYTKFIQRSNELLAKDSAANNLILIYDASIDNNILPTLEAYINDLYQETEDSSKTDREISAAITFEANTMSFKDFLKETEDKKPNQNFVALESKLTAALSKAISALAESNLSITKSDDNTFSISYLEEGVETKDKFKANYLHDFISNDNLAISLTPSNTDLKVTITLSEKIPNFISK